MGRSYKLQHTGPKALAVVQPVSSRGCEPLRDPGDLHSNPPSCAHAAACGHLLLALLSHYQASCQAEEGTVPKHLYLSLDPPQMTKNIYSAWFHTTESTATHLSLAIFRKSDYIVIISAYLFWLSLDGCFEEAKMLNSEEVSSTIF